ncbi:hypothetical protein [Crocosphaera sp.]|uniref:hypothetical protein n=1 Tax=Crocosphaera sp. TaxID=2729996 RepID=UPI00260D09A4|nr:hypothetical protein [Crocosphaera sp.]MDJ0579075.1 hypothetical protein [Crocosphaera sp.]
MPYHLVLKKWLGIKKAKQREINQNSFTVAQVASLAYNYLRDPKKSFPSDFRQFLPFEPETKHEKTISQKTAQIFVKCRDEGLIPSNILYEIAQVDGLYETICKLGKQ